MDRVKKWFSKLFSETVFVFRHEWFGFVCLLFVTFVIFPGLTMEPTDTGKKVPVTLTNTGDYVLVKHDKPVYIQAGSCKSFDLTMVSTIGDISINAHPQDDVVYCEYYSTNDQEPLLLVGSQIKLTKGRDVRFILNSDSQFTTRTPYTPGIRVLAAIMALLMNVCVVCLILIDINTKRKKLLTK